MLRQDLEEAEYKYQYGNIDSSQRDLDRSASASGSLDGCIMVDGRQWPAQVMAGKGLVTAWPMLDSSKLLADEDWVQLQSKLQQDGYLLIRGALDRASVQEVRLVAIQKALATCCWPCSPASPAAGMWPGRSKAEGLEARAVCRRFQSGMPWCSAISPGCPTAEFGSNICLQLKLTDGAGKIGLLQRQDIASSLEVRRVLESSYLFRLMRGLMQVGNPCLDRCSAVSPSQQRLPNALGYCLLSRQSGGLLSPDMAGSGRQRPLWLCSTWLM